MAIHQLPPVTTLVWMKWATDAGYAITALERLFFQSALQLAGGNPDLIHFAYPDTTPGPPPSLPPAFRNVVSLSIEDVSASALRLLEDHLRRTRPTLVITFDVQPTHPTFSLMRKHGVETIVCYWGAPISGPSPGWKRLLKRMALHASPSKADLLIFESRAMADLATMGRGVPQEMVEVVPLGVDTDRFRPAASDYVYEVFGLPRDRKVIVYSGHCTPRKGIATLIGGAMELLGRRGRRDVCFLLCGDRGRERDLYEALYAQSDFAEWIRFAGYRTDLLPILQSAFCGVIPSTGWDSYTLSSIEMAATGLPVVASRLQGLAEAVVDGQTGLLFEPGDVHALADCLQALLDQPARARELGLAGRRRCEDSLTMERQRERFLAAICRRLPAHRVPD